MLARLSPLIPPRGAEFWPERGSARLQASGRQLVSGSGVRQLYLRSSTRSVVSRQTVASWGAPTKAATVRMREPIVISDEQNAGEVCRNVTITEGVRHSGLSRLLVTALANDGFVSTLFTDVSKAGQVIYAATGS